MTNLSKPQLHHLPVAVTWAREKAGLTKTALADECGVSLALISMIESGDRSATPALLRRIAEVLNCPVVMLERRRDVGPPTAGKGWICPVCGHLNRPELVVCERTPDHDGEED